MTAIAHPYRARAEGRKKWHRAPSQLDYIDSFFFATPRVLYRRLMIILLCRVTRGLRYTFFFFLVEREYGMCTRLNCASNLVPLFYSEEQIERDY